MNPRTLLKEMESSPARDRFVDAVYDEMARYCQEHNVSVDDLSNEELEELAEGFVTRGFGISQSDSTKSAKERYHE